MPCPEPGISEGDLAWQAQILAAHHTYEQTPRGDGAQPSEDWLIAHADFHTALLAGCANPGYATWPPPCGKRPNCTGRWSRPEPADPHHWTDLADHEEHRHLLDAVMARDRDRADSALRRLIGLTSGMVLDTEPHA